MAEEEEAAPKGDIKRQASEEEVGLTLEGPAIFANRVFITVGLGGVRIAFTEEHTGAPAVFRSAVMMPIQSAISLKNVLADLLREPEEKIAEFEATAKDDG